MRKQSLLKKNMDKNKPAHLRLMFHRSQIVKFTDIFTVRYVLKTKNACFFNKT